MTNKIVRAFKFPGYPRIDVVQKLRSSVEREMSKVDKSAFAVYDVASYQTEHGPHTFIGRKASKEGLMGFAAYFDKAAYTNLIDDINKQMYEKGREQLREILKTATLKAQQEIKGRKRNFKSGDNANKSETGDIYNSLADSLGFGELEEGSKKSQRLQRYVAGSWDIRGVGSAATQPGGFQGQPVGNQPTGFFGSRMKEHPSDKSLTEIYARGRSKSSVVRKRTISEPAKRLKGYFK